MSKICTKIKGVFRMHLNADHAKNFKMYGMEPYFKEFLDAACIELDIALTDYRDAIMSEVLKKLAEE